MRNSLVPSAGAIFGAMVIAACSPGGGHQNAPTPCGPNENTAFQTEIYDVSYASKLHYCPLVINADSAGFTSGGFVDVDFNVHGGTAGFVGTDEVWTTGLSSGAHMYASGQFSFTDNGTGTNGHTILRGTLPTYTWYAHTVTGQTERDSLDVKYPTVHQYNNSFGGQFTAEGYGAVPVVRQGTAGDILGPSGALPGGTGSFRIEPAWDTTGYKYKWYVNGVFSAPDTFATFNTTFGSVGTYTVRNDQIMATGDVSTSTRNIEVYNVSISGPTSVQPFATCEWTASVSSGTAPYTYAWQAVSSNGTAQYFDFMNDGGSFAVQLTVTDATGAQVAAINKNVTVSSSAPTCTF